MYPLTSSLDKVPPCAVAPEKAFSDAQSTEVRNLADLKRWLSTAEAGSTVVYHRGFLALDRGAGSRLGDDAGEELNHIATEVMAMAEAGRVHLVQRRHGACDYTYIAVMSRTGVRRRLGSPARGSAS